MLHMSTTTIRSGDELKARIAAAAQREGKSAHAFIVDAIAQAVAQSELDEEFHRVAEKRWAKLLATGQTVSLDSARVHLDARLKLERPSHPARRTGR